MKVDSMTREYLQNTKQVYKDFINLAEDLDSAKDFIRSLDKVKLSEYKEIILAEHKRQEVISNWTINILFTIFISLIVMIIVNLFGSYPYIFIGTIFGFTSILFLGVLFFTGGKRKKNLYRLFYFLEHFDEK